MVVFVDLDFPGCNQSVHKHYGFAQKRSDKLASLKSESQKLYIPFSASLLIGTDELEAVHD